MEQCIARLDVAMFNAILRESDDEIPTDPMSDPITDPKVLPIPSGKFSFGAGVQLKNAVCRISFVLTVRSHDIDQWSPPSPLPSLNFHLLLRPTTCIFLLDWQLVQKSYWLVWYGYGWLSRSWECRWWKWLCWIQKAILSPECIEWSLNAPQGCAHGYQY